jgi:hypothetical protein
VAFKAAVKAVRAETVRVGGWEGDVVGGLDVDGGGAGGRDVLVVVGVVVVVDVGAGVRMIVVVWLVVVVEEEGAGGRAELGPGAEDMVGSSCPSVRLSAPGWKHRFVPRIPKVV